MEDKRVGLAPTKGNYYPFETGYICIPPEVDRDKFVKNCLITGFVSIQPIVGGAIHRVRCDKWILQQVDFPASSKDQGSLVGYCVDPKKKSPYIVSCYDKINEYHDLDENQFKLQKSTDDGSVTVLGDGNGRLLINVSANKANKGRIDINLTNLDDTTQLNVNLKGSATIYASGKVFTQTNDEILLEATDNEDTSSISITKDRINHDGGSEPMALGNTLKTLIEEIIDEADTLATESSKIVVPTGVGPSGVPINATKFVQISTNLKSIKGKLEIFLSTKSFLD